MLLYNITHYIYHHNFIFIIPIVLNKRQAREGQFALLWLRPNAHLCACTHDEHQAMAMARNKIQIQQSRTILATLVEDHLFEHSYKVYYWFQKSCRFLKRFFLFQLWRPGCAMFRPYSVCLHLDFQSYVRGHLGDFTRL